MIFTATDPRAKTAQIWDENGNDLCKKYFITWYNTEAQIAEIVVSHINDMGQNIVEVEGGKAVTKEIHLPGTKLVLVEPFKKHQ